MLAGEGLVDFEEHISSYLVRKKFEFDSGEFSYFRPVKNPRFFVRDQPEFALAEDYASELVNLRDLLAHRTG